MDAASRKSFATTNPPSGAKMAYIIGALLILYNQQITKLQETKDTMESQMSGVETRER